MDLRRPVLRAAGVLNGRPAEGHGIADQADQREGPDATEAPVALACELLFALQSDEERQEQHQQEPGLEQEEQEQELELEEQEQELELWREKLLVRFL